MESKEINEQTKEILNNVDEVEQVIQNDELLNNVDEVEQVIKNDELLKNVDEVKYGIQNELSNVNEVEYVININDVGDVKLSKSNVSEKPKKVRSRENCAICNKSVGYSKMKEHMRTHTLERPYCCNVCGARFTQNANMRRHALKHSKIKPHKCELCDKAYARLELLKDHVRTHTGEKPFVCKYCERSFSTKTGLRQHLHSHTGGEFLYYTLLDQINLNGIILSMYLYRSRDPNKKTLPCIVIEALTVE